MMEMGVSLCADGATVHRHVSASMGIGMGMGIVSVWILYHSTMEYRTRTRLRLRQMMFTLHFQIESPGFAIELTQCEVLLLGERCSMVLL